MEPPAEDACPPDLADTKALLKERFLIALAKTRMVTTAVAQLGISGRALYRLKKADADFERAWISLLPPRRPAKKTESKKKKSKKVGRLCEKDGAVAKPPPLAGGGWRRGPSQELTDPDLASKQRPPPPSLLPRGEEEQTGMAPSPLGKTAHARQSPRPKQRTPGNASRSRAKNAKAALAADRPIELVLRVYRQDILDAAGRGIPNTAPAKRSAPRHRPVPPAQTNTARKRPNRDLPNADADAAAEPLTDAERAHRVSQLLDAARARRA